MFRQIVDGIKAEVARGHLDVDEKLPTVRALATQLLVNPNTVQKAYNQLINEGIAYSRHGVGVFVSDIDPTLGKKQRFAQAKESVDSVITECIHLGMSASDIGRLVKERLVDFRKGGRHE